MGQKNSKISKIKGRYRNKLFKLRADREVRSQTQLAHMTGIPLSAIAAIEAQHLFLSSPYALRICEKLGCTLNDLYEPCTPQRRRKA